MSVRVNDLLKLPSLREATVLSGKNQLDTSVASLSFLEVSDMSLFSEKLHKTNEYHAGEILIGSFCAIRHDVVKQCETIRSRPNLVLRWDYRTESCRGSDSISGFFRFYFNPNA